MPRILSTIAIMQLLIPSAIAEVNYRDFRPGYWGIHAERCGEIYQGYVVYQVEHLMANLRKDMWRRARELGAREDEIAVLEKRFEAGRKKAMKRRFNQDPSENFHDIGVMMLKGDADWNRKYCTETLEK